uniref:H(+)-exporting diphosphatase n=1 Tax=Haptolina brevifila TaxID=156173 RepID=A0A7S2HCU3_9EUKA|mmetsp:Transcript_53414/g.106201  ORF Transcript_53414/g.106201 Transcript_53414/m.106201 type:complete len:132 (+) Transcript_53414:65-460(+)
MMTLKFALLLIATCDAFQVVPGIARNLQPVSLHEPLLRALPPWLVESNEDKEGEAPETNAPEAKAEVKKTATGGMPTDFLGVFDVTTTFGALGASIVVSVLFVVLVEGIKFIDPNPATRGMFGNIMDGAAS